VQQAHGGQPQPPAALNRTKKAAVTEIGRCDVSCQKGKRELVLALMMLGLDTAPKKWGGAA